MDSNRGSKKVKASSSSSPAINLPDNDDDQQQAAALPHPPHRLHVSYLPDIAHDAITACLTMDDMHRMMETSPWGLATYGGRVKEVKIPHHFMGHTHRALAISLLQRRPALLRFNALNPLEVEALGEAMKSQQFSRLQTLEISLHGNFPQEGRSCFTSLFEGLAGGACPKLNNIRLDLRWEEEKQSEGDAVLASLGAALQSRMRGGGSCCGLKRLEIFGRCLTDLSSVLSSGACEGLEDLLLASLERSIVGDKTYEAVTEWIMRTKAINLRLFTLLVNGPLLPPAMGSALSSPGVAPKLRTLNVAVVAGAFLTHITTAIQRGAWPELKNIMVAPDHDISSDALSCLMEAICVGASELRTLALLDAGVKEDGARAMARAISKGACPRLEALDLVSTTIGDGGVMELSRAFKVGALCNTTLRRLSLQDCDISPHGLAELCECFHSSLIVSNYLSSYFQCFSVVNYIVPI